MPTTPSGRVYNRGRHGGVDLVVWAVILMAAGPGNGWHLKEVAYQLPLALVAPGAAATTTLPGE